MAVTAQDIIRRVVETLQDATSVRWPIDELVRYLNDGQREIVLLRPDAVTINGPIPLVPGARQALPSLAIKLLDVTHNSAGSRRAVRLVNREILDAQLPGWHAQAGAAEVLHYMYDPREPRTFLIYPPAVAGASVDGTYAAMPKDLPEPTAGGTYQSVTGSLGVPDIYANVLQDYVLYRAYSKDAEYAGNAARAQAHYTLFQAGLGNEIKATVAVAPSSTGNPNRPQTQGV